MRKPSYTSQFERDLRLQQRRGKNIAKLKDVLTALINEAPWAQRPPALPLHTNLKQRRESPVEPHWLLTYHTNGDEIIFERTETHSDLFE